MPVCSKTFTRPAARATAEGCLTAAHGFWRAALLCCALVCVAQVDTLFDESLWADGVEGGGMHWWWAKEDGHLWNTHVDEHGVEHVDHSRRHDAYFDREDLRLARRKIIDAFIPLKEGPAKRIVDLVQELQDLVYRLIPGPAATIESLDLGRTQPQPYPEFDGVRHRFYPGNTPAAAMEELRVGLAILERDQRGEAPLLYVRAATKATLISKFRSCIEMGDATPSYVQYARVLAVNNTFHVDMDAVLNVHGEVQHGDFKAILRTNAKIEEAYDTDASLPLPGCIHLKDPLRIVAVCDTHRKIEEGFAALTSKYTPVVVKNRLGQQRRAVK